MIIRVWGEVDGVEIPLRPLKDKPDYWYGYCDWSPNLLHMELWAENDRGARGHFDGFVKSSISAMLKPSAGLSCIRMSYV